MTPQEEAAERSAVATEYVMRQCAGAAVVSADGAAWGAYNWLTGTSAGLPYVPLMHETARDDARFWAETATPIELECYALAAADRLAGLGAMFGTKQIRRLSGALWRRMSPDEKAAFLAWAGANP